MTRADIFLMPTPVGRVDNHTTAICTTVRMAFLSCWGHEARAEKIAARASQQRNFIFLVYFIF